jgi:predicted ATP-dependent endonuclease of OLD family
VRLRSVVIQGYRRFAEPQTLYLGPGVVAIVGPNEAGKTSLLSALEHLPNDSTFDRRELTDRQQPTSRLPIVSARYAVEDEDKGAAEGLLQENTDYIYTHILNSDETIVAEIQPRLQRDTSLRAAFPGDVARLIDRHALRLTGDVEHEDNEIVTARAQALAGVLSEANEDLADAELDELRSFTDSLAEVGSLCSDPGAAGRLQNNARILLDIESLENPRTRLLELLRQRLPPMLHFDDQARELHSDYSWSGTPTATPALENLLHLTGASYADYRSLAVDRDRRDELSTFERRLNRKLKTELAKWSQSDLTVTLRADHESLAIHVTDTETDRDVVLGERSAGLRMFASLLAFCARHSGTIKPILLFDEAETHLHYNAQADLMHVFATQDVAQAILYTTHSIGCLPEDLGRCIRVVAPIGNERSAIRNEFWTRGVGLTPLMLAMGASAMAFLPARYVLLGEGATEAVLLPSLFRAATGSDESLGFQVACGTAQVPTDLAGELEAEAGNVAYIFDADDGGKDHAAKIAERAGNEGRVFVLGDGKEPGLCTEDLVDATTYVAAVNSVLKDTRNTTEYLSLEDLPESGRGAHVDEWCRSRGIARLSKARIAERVLRFGDETGLLLESNRSALVASLYSGILRALRGENTNSPHTGS